MDGAGGLPAAAEEVFRAGADWVWLLDGSSAPRPDALREAERERQRRNRRQKKRHGRR